MREVLVNKHKLQVYDSIDELPIVRYQKCNKYMVIDSGIGSDLQSVVSHIDVILQQINIDKDKAIIELTNMRQNMIFLFNGINPKHFAFVPLIYSIDGKELIDISDTNVEKIYIMLNPTKEEADKLINDVKKKS
jgi:hypothetical protein